MISVGVEYSPETGTVSCIIRTDAKYNPDAVDDMAKRVAETFAKAIGTVVERAADPN